MARGKYRDCDHCHAIHNRSAGDRLIDTVAQRPALGAIRANWMGNTGHWWEVRYPISAPNGVDWRLCNELRVENAAAVEGAV